MSHAASVPTKVPELIESDSGAVRVIRFLWEEVDRSWIPEFLKVSTLLEDLEAIIEFWLRDSKYASGFSTPPALSRSSVLKLAQPIQVVPRSVLWNRNPACWCSHPNFSAQN